MNVMASSRCCHRIKFTIEMLQISPGLFAAFTIAVRFILHFELQFPLSYNYSGEMPIIYCRLVGLLRQVSRSHMLGCEIFRGIDCALWSFMKGGRHGGTWRRGVSARKFFAGRCWARIRHSTTLYVDWIISRVALRHS